MQPPPRPFSLPATGLATLMLATIGFAAGPAASQHAAGFLPMTRSEQRALGLEHRREYTFERTDTNDDGVISIPEWAAQNWARLIPFDADRDGVISPVEFTTSVCPVPRTAQLQWTDERCIAGRHRRLRELDRSGDGLLSEDEDARASLDYFRQADLCRDNVLVREELNGDVRRHRVSCAEIRARR